MDKRSYKVIIARTNDYPRLDQLERQVTQAMEQGWKPQGGIAISGGLYYQAMVRDLEKAKD